MGKSHSSVPYPKGLWDKSYKKELKNKYAKHQREVPLIDKNEKYQNNFLSFNGKLNLNLPDDVHRLQILAYSGYDLNLLRKICLPFILIGKPSGFVRRLQRIFWKCN